MAIEVTISEAKARFAELPARVEAGEEVVIKRGSTPIARLSALAPRRPRTLGGDEGLFEIPDEFESSDVETIPAS